MGLRDQLYREGSVSNSDHTELKTKRREEIEKFPPPQNVESVNVCC